MILEERNINADGDVDEDVEQSVTLGTRVFIIKGSGLALAPELNPCQCVAQMKLQASPGTSSRRFSIED